MRGGGAESGDAKGRSAEEGRGSSEGAGWCFLSGRHSSEMGEQRLRHTRGVEPEAAVSGWHGLLAELVAARSRMRLRMAREPGVLRIDGAQGDVVRDRKLVAV